MARRKHPYDQWMAVPRWPLFVGAAFLSGGQHAISWAKDMVQFSLENLRGAGEGDRVRLLRARSARIAESVFLSYLPQSYDRLLIADALCLGCDAFITTDYKTILRFRSQITKRVGLMLFSPYEYLKTWKKWAALHL